MYIMLGMHFNYIQIFTFYEGGGSPRFEEILEEWAS